MEQETAKSSRLLSRVSDSNNHERSSCHTNDTPSSTYHSFATSDFSTSASARSGRTFDLLNSADNFGGNQPNNSTSTENVETLVEGLEADISGGDYIRFFNELDHRGTGGTTTTWEVEENVVLEAFRLMRYHVIKRQISTPDVVLLTGEGWVKTIKSKFTAFENSNAVAISCLLTFLTLSSLPGNYKNLIVRRGGVDCAMKTLEEYWHDKQACSLACALILSLSLNEKEGLNASYRQIVSLVKRMVSLISRGGYGADIALRVVFQFTCHRKKLPDTGKSLSHLVKRTLRNEKKNTIALFNVMMECDVRESTVEAAMSLLWRLSVPKDEFDDDELYPTSDDAMRTIIAAMDSFNSITIREAGCGTLANMFIRKGIPAELSQMVFVSMQRFILRSESIDEGLATCALHAICNMLEKTIIGSSLVLNERIIEALIFLMKKYPKSEELIEFACLGIGRAARHNQGIKESLMALGAFDQVKCAFEQFVLTREDDPSLDVKDASLCAFATLTGCLSGAQEAINTGLLDIFETLLAVETDRDFAVVLDIIISNTRACVTNDGFPTSLEDTLLQQPQIFSKLMENTTNDADATSLIQSLLGVGQTHLESAFNTSDGFPSLLSAMARYSDSANFQEYGCALLAEIYFHLPYPVKDVGTQQGPWAPQNQREALVIIHKAMSAHLDQVNVQINGCLSILNLLHPVSEPGGSAQDRLAISLVIELPYAVVLDCLRLHGSNIDLQKSAIPALSVSISVARTKDFKPWATRIVQHLCNMLLQFTGNNPIEALVLDALVITQEAHTSVKSEYSTSDVNTILTLVGSDSSEISGRSSSVLSNLLSNDLEMSRKVMECHGAIEIILSTLGMKREELRIQINIYSILQSLVTCSADCGVGIAKLLDQHNGIHKLCMGITSHPQHRMIAITLCRILSSIVCYLDDNAFVRSRDAIKLSLIEGLEYHVENSDVVSAILDVMCTCCDRDDDFKKYLLGENRSRMIINTMQLSLGSVSLQSSGCNLLAMLSIFGTGKEQIGKCGGVPTVVNALLAHTDSTEVQRKGLIALKNMATAPSNKPKINKMGGETAVVYALWIHYRNPEVVSIGLSALNNIAVDSITRTVAKINDPVLMIVIAAMKSFPMDGHVQKNACFYLKTCSYVPENVRIMSEKSEDLIPLLLQAGENFPDQCRGRANAVVTKITSY
ncbi:unnamed protein product [Pseudo-nitzschia multistriata]|uniref:Armadillo repeat-containing domain-containing protein n=1 Tax=Pseudo-nitzschia multistriata TaxID=183589 RepID=A0A448Z658_9STRA|nr:unnamed protein product [Pseudo-nitzschia multistriata]